VAHVLVTNDAAAHRRRLPRLLPEAAVVLLVVALLPLSDIRLSGWTSFVPMMIALVACFDILCVVFLVRQFRDTGDRRALALSWAYVSSLVIVLGWAGSFPGVFGSEAPLAATPSTTPWLWVVWHTMFPCLLAVACLPWPQRWTSPVNWDRRRRLAWSTSAIAAGTGVVFVAAVVALSDRLPVLIEGLDTGRMTELVGPVMLPLVVAATAVTMLGARRFDGPERWTGLAAVVALGDVVLTLVSIYRFSLGWYAGRTLTVVSAAVVAIAMLAGFARVKQRLAEEGERLRAALERSDSLERLQDTLLDHMPAGVLMQHRSGEVVATNPA